MQNLNDLPRVAILLTAYNGERWLNEQLESIKSQVGIQFDVYVSVDLSNDNTYELFQKQAAGDSRVNLLAYGERFGGAAPNFYRLITEVNMSGYDFVSFSDQDDIWHSDKIKRACDTLRTGDADVYASNVTAFWADGHEELIDKAQPQRLLDHFFESAGPGCTYVFKREAMLELQAYVRTLTIDINNCVMHDWFSYAFCRARGYRWYIDPQPSMRYRQHEHNQIGANTNWTAYKERFAMICNKTYRRQVEALVEMVAPERLPSLSSRLYLLKNFSQLRRRPRDRYFLLVMLLLGIY